MTLVERVARALCVAAGHDPDGPTMDVLVPGDPDCIYPWAGYRAAARAALAALRVSDSEAFNLDHGSADQEAINAYIDAALAEGGP